MPDKAQRVIGSTERFKVLYGGRRSSKTYSFVNALLFKAAFTPLRILCTRELQVSIRDSILKTLRVRIQDLELDEYFDIQKTCIYSKCGSEFIFMGVRHNVSEIKGLEGVDICLIEEAEQMSQDSWDILEATISKDGSEIWVNFNPEYEQSPTYQKFIKNKPPYCAIEHMTYRDNYYFPEISRQQMEYDKVNDFEKYSWIWEGEIKKYHDALIFSKVFIEAFEAPKCVEFHYGCDWGYSNDPMAINRMFIMGRDLFIDFEFYASNVELTEGEMSAAFDTIPTIKQGRIRADNSRPETIAFVKRLGYDIVGEAKLTIDEGITYLKAFERIVIHPRCKGAREDFENYRWKVDPQTKEVLTVPVDKSNHVPDNVRYALRNLIKKKKSLRAV